MPKGFLFIAVLIFLISPFRQAFSQPCGHITDFRLYEVSAGAALLTWDSAECTPTASVVIEYDTLADFSTATQQPATTSPLLISGLSPNTQYYVRIAVRCDTAQVQQWTQLSFITLQMPCGDGFSDSWHTIARGNFTNQYLAGYSLYKYGITQQIYRAEELGGTQTISKIALHAYLIAKQRNISIYLGHTQQTSVTSWIQPDDLTLVYTGVLPITSASAEGTFIECDFSAPFSYNGTDNLLLVIDDNSGSFQYSPINQFYTHNNHPYSAGYNYSDNTNYNPRSLTGTPEHATTRMNIKWFSSSCDHSDTCDHPLIFVERNVTDTTTLRWGSANQSVMWNIYMADSLGNDSLMTQTAEGRITFIGLRPDTQYTVRVVPSCANGDMGYAGTITFKTPCPTLDGSCIRFDRLYSCHTRCSHGTTTQPDLVEEVVDFGTDSKNSFHTVHRDTSERDPRTDNQLTTICPGTTASVRLGSWRMGNYSQSIAFDQWIDTAQSNLLTIHYALIQNGASIHPRHSLPRFSFAITAIDGTPYSDSCHTAVIQYDSSWHTTNDNIAWSGWMHTGFDLSPFHGHTITISFFSANCECNGHNHYSYAYISTECGKLALRCDSTDCHHRTLSAPDGYTCRWYRQDAPDSLLGTCPSIDISTSGTYICTLTNPLLHDCSTVLSTHIDIPAADTPTDTSVIACEQFEWHEMVFHDDGIYTFSRGQNNCAVTDTLRLTIVHGSHLSLADTACDSYLWHGTEFRFSGTYTFDYTDDHQCESHDTLHLTIHTSSDTTEHRIVNENSLPYIWNQTTFNGPDTVSLALADQWGCDSSVTMILSVIANHDTVCDSIVCDNDLPILWNGILFESEGEQRIILHSAAGTDSTITMRLHVNRSSHTSIDTAVCDNQLPFVWEGNEYYQPTTQTSELTNVAGCDSIATLNLAIRRSFASEIDDTICDGTIYFFNGTSITTEGRYTQTGLTADGCDSTIVLDLTVLSPPEVVIRDQYSCSTSLHHVTATTDAPYLCWSSAPQTEALDGHEHDNPLTIETFNDLELTLFADLQETPTCPTSRSIAIGPIAAVAATMEVKPAVLTPEENTLYACDRSIGNSGRKWYLNHTFIGDSVTLATPVATGGDAVLLELMAFNDYCSDTASKTIPVHSPGFYIPNIFTPNLYTNNTFGIESICVEQFVMHIYSRTGQLVFSATNSSDRWDGTHDGSPCPAGTYTYSIRYTTTYLPLEWHHATGTVTLVR